MRGALLNALRAGPGPGVFESVGLNLTLIRYYTTDRRSGSKYHIRETPASSRVRDANLGA